MDFVRDFVGGSCEGGNALSQFVGNVEKSGAQRDMWQREFMVQDSGTFNDAHLRAQVPTMDSSNFFRPGPMGMKQENFEEFDQIWGQLPPDSPLQMEVNPAVQDTVKDFIHSTLHNGPMPLVELHPADIRFTPVQKLQIRNRAASLARHFCVDDESTAMMEGRLRVLFNSFGLSEQEASIALHEGLNQHGAWVQDYQHFREPEHVRHFSKGFERVWEENARQLPEVPQGWVDDYDQNWRDYKGPEMSEEEMKTMNATFDEVKNETVEDWVQEFTEQEEHEREEEERWFAQFLPQGQNYVHQNQPSADDWINEFSRQRDNTSISSLTEKISQIPDEKLQQSNFMKFIKQIDSGEVDLDQLQTQTHDY